LASTRVSQSVVAEGFLNHDRLAELDGFHGDREMHVVRRRDGDDVDLVGHGGEHFPVVGEEFRVGKSLDGTTGAVFIDIAEEGDAVSGGDFRDVAGSFAAAADGGDVEFFRDLFLAEQDIGSERGAGDCGGGFDEVAA
jgi:hypothetical protein